MNLIALLFPITGSLEKIFNIYYYDPRFIFWSARLRFFESAGVGASGVLWFLVGAFNFS